MARRGLQIEARLDAHAALRCVPKPLLNHAPSSCRFTDLHLTAPAAATTPKAAALPPAMQRSASAPKAAAAASRAQQTADPRHLRAAALSLRRSSCKTGVPDHSAGRGRRRSRGKRRKLDSNAAPDTGSGTSDAAMHPASSTVPPEGEQQPAPPATARRSISRLPAAQQQQDAETAGATAAPCSPIRSNGTLEKTARPAALHACRKRAPAILPGATTSADVASDWEADNFSVASLPAADPCCTQKAASEWLSLDDAELPVAAVPPAAIAAMASHRNSVADRIAVAAHAAPEKAGTADGNSPAANPAGSGAIIMLPQQQPQQQQPKADSASGHVVASAARPAAPTQTFTSAGATTKPVGFTAPKNTVNPAAARAAVAARHRREAARSSTACNQAAAGGCRWRPG